MVPRYTLYPDMLLEVLADQFSATLCCGGVVPEPVTDCEVGVFEALLLKTMLAKAVPVVWGEKSKEKERLFPAGIVTGKLMPLNENSDWLTPTDETVTGPLLAVRVADWI